MWKDSMDSPVLTKSSVTAATEAKERRAARWTLAGCSLIVFVTSVCIMVIELTASRLIARAVGSSLYTWTSVIGVILAGISLGNFLGGWLADRYDHRKLLSWLFLISSASCITIYPMLQFVGTNRPQWMSWPMWIVTVVGSVFLHPAIAMGTISPITASMALAKAKSTGSTVGNVYAWGAMGSILGTFLAGFVLISAMGTQNIIWLTAATLALLGVCVASGRMMFKGVMLFGWLQFVIWVGFFASAKQPELDAKEEAKWWHKVLGNAHEIGIELGLRNDDPNEYHAESDYFSINVSQSKPEGGSNSEEVSVLVLDHLVHSYYDPEHPTQLEYTYEKVYAALTERAAESWNRRIEADLETLPFDISQLPAPIKYDATTKKLSSQGAINLEQFNALLVLSSQADYWKVIHELTSEENTREFDGTAALALDELPKGITIPSGLRNKIHYDSTLAAMTRYTRLTNQERDTLLGLGPDGGLYVAASKLYRESRQTSTLFLGGGGFVFPRWIEAFFPHEPLIHVLELDPAVKLAVQKKMGLPPDDQTRVKTIIGDARNSVDDLLNGLNHDSKYPGKHNYYDFVYGDAFNDFSVPWHLTTKEFTEKIKELLTPDEGLFLVNIIDIYSRVQVPQKLSKSDRDADKPQPGIEFLPSELIPDILLPGDWNYAKAPFEEFEIQLLGPDSDSSSDKPTYVIGCRKPITAETRDRLLKLAPENSSWQQSIAELASRSGTFKSGRFLGAYVNTVCQVFPNVYVFSTDSGLPSDDRDTFVIACSLKKLNFDHLETSGRHWSEPPFARMESTSDTERVYSSQMRTILELSQGITLTDDYAPVDNLLVPVFSKQDD
jgi:predicted membrane-bound spermidine synthase